MEPELTERRASEIADQIERGEIAFSPMPRQEWPKPGRGRPSLSGDSAASPRVTFRLEPAVRVLAAERAEHEGKTVSALAREALERYLAS